MNEDNAKHIESMLPADSLVLDVGGGMAPFKRADWIIDALPYDERNALLRETETERKVKFRRDTWVQFDLCSRSAWPFVDDQFDFAVCSHVLEDVRDPVWVCSEMLRVAKAGYIEVPSRAVEQSLGIEHPRFAGYYHHRWLVSVQDGGLVFRQKPHLLHVTREAIVARVGFWREINPQLQYTALFWQNELTAHEVLEFNEREVVRELCEFSAVARDVPDLLVKSQIGLGKRLRRAAYYFRLAWS